MAQTSRLLQSRLSSEDLSFHVITHFVGPADRSDEIGALARRIIGELQLAWGELVDEGKLPDDDKFGHPVEMRTRTSDWVMSYPLQFEVAGYGLCGHGVALPIMSYSPAAASCRKPPQSCRVHGGGV